MALTYSSRQWVYSPEKTDYKSPRPYQDFITVQVPVLQRFSNKFGIGSRGLLDVRIPANANDVQIKNAIDQAVSQVPNTQLYAESISETESTNPYEGAYQTFNKSKQLNDQAKIDTDTANLLNKQNTAKNAFHQYVQNIVNGTKAGGYAGNYLSAKAAISNQKSNLVAAGYTDAEAQKIVDDIVGPTGQYRNYYVTEAVTPWNPSVLPGNLSTTLKQRSDLGDQFNKYQNGTSGYYFETPQGQAALATWKKAVADDNLDIIARYGTKEAYAKQDYINQITDSTKTPADIAAIRASEARPLSPFVTEYREQVFPDALKQQTRDQVQNQILGLAPTSAEERQRTSLEYQLKDTTGGYTPEISTALDTAISDTEKQQTIKFGQFRQQILQDTINQLQQAKRQEAQLSLFRSSSLGKELTSLQEDFNNSIIGDLNVGGLMAGNKSDQALKSKLDLGLSDVFGTKNGLIYNWEQWFNNEIEKKYAGDLDVPNDYVPPSLRTVNNGFIDSKTASEWKKYDDAYAGLKTSPNDPYLKSIVAGRPANYVPVENRKTVKPEWETYESELKARGYVDPKVVVTWGEYDKAYDALTRNPNDTAAQAIYDKRPADYIPPDKRMDKDVQFAKDFFSSYLKPRFDASQSIAEFQDYIDVQNNTQNPFQTQDRINALKLAAESSVSKWFTDLQKAGDSRFNSDYYFDPVGYLKTNGVGDKTNPLLPPTAFGAYADTVAGQNALQQSAKVNFDWEAAKRGEVTTDDYGNKINWMQEAYNYGIDINNKADFAKLHYQFVGNRTPQKDANGKIVYGEDGKPIIQGFDPAPDVYAPQIAKTYIANVLTPYLVDKANKIGSVFGEFVKPDEYVNEILKAVNLDQNKDQWSQVLKNYGIDPNSSLTEIKDELVSSLSQGSSTDIKQKLSDFIKKGTAKAPTQLDVGVEFIQREKAPTTKEEEPTGVYAVFKNAGFTGTEQEFYDKFMPDSSQEDINLLNAAFTPAGKATQLLPTISGTGLEKISSMAQLFGDTDVQEVLGTAGVAAPTAKPSLFTQLLKPGEEAGISDPFAQEDATYGASGTTTKNQIGIGNPFDDVGINDPFSDTSDPFTSSSMPFSSPKSSVTSLKIGPSLSFLGSSSGASSKNSGFTSSFFDSFGGGFGF